MSLGWLSATNVRAVEEAHEEVHEWTKVEDVQPGGEGLALSVDALDGLVALDGVGGSGGLANGLSESLGSGGAVDDGLDGGWSSGVLRTLDLDDGGSWHVVGDEGVHGGEVDTKNELHDLHGGEGLLDGLWNADAESGDGVVGVLKSLLAQFTRNAGNGGFAYHHGVDARVQEAEEPDGWSHVAHTSPHAHHGTGVVISLKSRGLLALGENDNGINDLVELGEVEEPSVECETLVPETATNGQGVGSNIGGETRGGVDKLAGGSVVLDRVGKARWAVELANRVNNANESVWARWAWDGGLECLPHANKGPCRVDGEEDVVEDDNPVEPASLGESPRLVTAGGVDLVHCDGGDGVDSRDGERNASIVGLLVELRWEVEWRDWSWWCDEGVWIAGTSWELEEIPAWKGEVDVWRHRDGCSVCITDHNRRKQSTTVDS